MAEATCPCALYIHKVRSGRICLCAYLVYFRLICANMRGLKREDVLLVWELSPVNSVPMFSFSLGLDVLSFALWSTCGSFINVRYILVNVSSHRQMCEMLLFYWVY